MSWCRHLFGLGLRDSFVISFQHRGEAWIFIGFPRFRPSFGSRPPNCRLRSAQLGWVLAIARVCNLGKERADEDRGDCYAARPALSNRPRYERERERPEDSRPFGRFGRFRRARVDSPALTVGSLLQGWWASRHAANGSRRNSAAGPSCHEAHGLVVPVDGPYGQEGQPQFLTG